MTNEKELAKDIQATARRIEVTANAIGELFTGPPEELTGASGMTTRAWLDSINANMQELATRQLRPLLDMLAAEGVDVGRHEALGRALRLIGCLSHACLQMGLSTDRAGAAAKRAEFIEKEQLVDLYIGVTVNCYATARVAQRLGETIRLARAEGVIQ